MNVELNRQCFVYSLCVSFNFCYSETVVHMWFNISRHASKYTFCMYNGCSALQSSFILYCIDISLC